MEHYLDLRALLLLTSMACGGTAIQRETPTEEGKGAVAPAPTPVGDSADAAPQAPGMDTPRPEQDPTCAKDSDCNESATDKTVRGTCWKEQVTGGSTCLCNPGYWKQASGRCGSTPPPPSCVDQGGSCTTWSACSSGGGYRTTSTSCADVCCVSTCSPTAVSQAGCYRNGTDAAYVPICVNGWETCEPGDSPDLRIR